ncbi:MAG: gfo/Idh/MocA family oxidoreductase [Microbacteriaceae bacterium]|nr:gfo/Idh/MocA family oxidoreductase [Microbacteriaceae bacterium]
MNTDATAAPRVRIGLIGSSGWAEGMYVSALCADPRVDFVAVAARNQERLDELASKWNIANTYTDAHELIDSDVDAVIIATPDSAHAEYALSALAARKHVLCEKPLALDVEQSAAMNDAAKASGLVNMVMFTFRFLPVLQQLRNRVAALGQITDARVEFRSSFARNSDYIWRLDPEHGIGVVGDIGSHVFDLAAWMLGDHKILAATATNLFHPQLKTFEQFTALAKTELGAALTLVGSMIDEVGDTGMEQLFEFQSPTTRLTVRIIFSGARAGVYTELRTAGEITTTFEPGEQNEHYASGPQSFISAILGQDVAIPTFADGHRAQILIDQVLKLAQR